VSSRPDSAQLGFTQLKEVGEMVEDKDKVQTPSWM
jgi:hypothetical protein